ncbi:beta-N-acetylhexosaminidase [Primorskyibacter flagellatus]|uniref:beta-N-acetylhexosaminidase n=1 Tax=Primorskyibacter flagellatus TaxID=1387277 RepID=A0A1W1YZ36_9RHOB|nr:beta-N-acetylhexosaminidase [Primorskyibacter flagellatus]
MHSGNNALRPVPTGKGAAILGCAGTVLQAEERRFFAQADPFGFILFSRNLETPDQVRRLCRDLREVVGRDAPILIDQEGGRVQRLRAPLARDWTPPLDFAAVAGPRAAEAMRLRYAIIAAELRALGIDSNCAPMIDIARPDTHAFLRNRCYGETLNTVVTLGRAVAEGTLAGGCLPVVKHIPGHGLAQLDSHLDLPRITADRATLQAQDFAAFRALRDLPMGMTAHLVYEAYDEAPATISPLMMALIRGEIGFGGLIMTDDISMQALSGSVADRGAAAQKAGCDVILHCNGELAEMRALMGALTPLAGLARDRAVDALAARPDAMTVDIETLSVKLDALLEDVA